VKRHRGQIAAGAGSNAIKTIEKKPFGVGHDRRRSTPLRSRFRYLSQGVTAVASTVFAQRRFTLEDTSVHADCRVEAMSAAGGNLGKCRLCVFNG
jgi:hypothetical protein